MKHNWLWTTIAKGLQPYEFDSARVFVWSQRRHRYETAYIERKLKGYYPVEVHADRPHTRRVSPSSWRKRMAHATAGLTHSRVTACA